MTTIYVIRKREDQDDWPGDIMEYYFLSKEDAQKRVEELIAEDVARGERRERTSFVESHRKWEVNQASIRALKDAGLPLPWGLYDTLEPVETPYVHNYRWGTQYDVEELPLYEA